LESLGLKEGAQNQARADRQFMHRSQTGIRYGLTARIIAKVIEAVFPRPPFRAPPKEFSQEIKILMVELFGLGDVASLSVVFDPLLRTYPRAKIFIVCQKWCQEIYHQDPRVAQVIGIPTPWKAKSKTFFSLSAWRQVIQAISGLQSLEFDWCIDTRGDVRSQLFARWCRPARLVGPRDYMGSNIILKGRLLSHSVGILGPAHRYQRNCDCLQPVIGRSFKYKIPSLRVQKSLRQASDKPRLLIHASGGWKYKHWPEKRWEALIKQLLADGLWSLGLLSAPGEENTARRLSEGSTIPIEKPCLSSLLGLIQSYDAMVGTDSGPLNLAMLSGIPVVDLMGPGDAVMWAPPPGRGFLLQEISNYPCHPCSQKRCVYPRSPCIEQISSRQAVDAVKSLWVNVCREING